MNKTEKEIQNYKGSDLRGREFKDKDLRCIDFRDADLRDVKFINCDLRKAFFNRSKLEGAFFDEHCKLEGANFEWAHIPNPCIFQKEEVFENIMHYGAYLP